ncbi:mitochondrial ribosome small subunit component [Spathaspora passalidarum NRRL Y-27907]|uniref:Mitochondrial ribosome small subunit component n=1 Tax=Spathaspora passalidarum (strain NRRL Y-27907 / 11-Y1) TaxID=619300 RepID=G3ALZ1_SPAPN|nr:mitochondrial ribosome small subunit component [Spathaspora passalidarum NRRL Y-27907]EGW33344.1 mitochondrial ribosome small subunit component [Spathaspora passalidarum NRRL Y-27907]
MSANHEFLKLVRNSKFAQVATPLSKNIRGDSTIPTHQIIYTPKNSAQRSIYGIKTALPKQVGSSFISFNDIDNYTGMPDVEKNSGKYYKIKNFQEMGLATKNLYSESNPLFPGQSTKSEPTNREETLVNYLNMNKRVYTSEVQKVLQKNPGIHREFKKWLAKNHPQAFVAQPSPAAMADLLKSFLHESKAVHKKEWNLLDFGKEDAQIRVLGNGGFSYNQKGRLTNTPNGIKHDVIAPGRLLSTKDAAIGGFVSHAHDRSISLQYNYARSYPGKHILQFSMPFKVSEAVVTDDGAVRVTAEGVKVGDWMRKQTHSYAPSNPNFQSTAERHKTDTESLQSLLNLILPN